MPRSKSVKTKSAREPWSESELQTLALPTSHAVAAAAVGRTANAVRMKRAELETSEVQTLRRRLTTASDDLSTLRQEVKSLQRTESVIEALTEAVVPRIKPIAPFQPVPPRQTDRGVKPIVESLVVHLSDEHCDQVVQPSRVGGMEQYDMNVALARAERYVDVIINHAKNNLSNYQFDELWVLAYGDHVNGEIHDSVKHSHYHNAFKSALACGQMHAQMIADLAPHFPRVNVLYLPGNHGRRTTKKEYDGPRNNWDYLVGQIAAAHLSKHSNVSVVCPDSFDAVVQIKGWAFHIQHGDDIKSWNSIPWYGIERSTRRLSALMAVDKSVVNYFVLGHFHSHATQQHTTGETFINGAWLATTPYVYNGLKGFSRPMQLIHGVHKQHGVSWRMPVYLKHDGDVNGPKRYSIAFAD